MRGFVTAPGYQGVHDDYDAHLLHLTPLWLRLSFGNSSASEDFQLRLSTALENGGGIVNVIINVADDILVFGEGNIYEEAVLDHDNSFAAPVEHCIRNNMKLNPDNLTFKMKELLSMGHAISDLCLREDLNKVSAVTKMPVPRTRAAYNGSLGYAAYEQNVSAVVKPLRMLAHVGLDFIWSKIQQDKFLNNKKDRPYPMPLLSYYVTYISMLYSGR